MINFIVFQFGWFAAILGAANQLNSIGLFLVVLCCSINLRMLPNVRLNLMLVILAIILGLVLDSLALNLNLIVYTSSTLWPACLAPLWILGLWALFATTLNGYLSWINRYPLIGVLGGVVYGPLAYLAGQKLGAIQHISGLPAWLYLGLTWGLAILLLLTMNRRWNAKLNQN